MEKKISLDIPNEDEELKDLMSNNKEDLNVDIIEKSIGVLGRWHIAIYLAVILCKLPALWQQLSIVVLAPPTNFTCIDNVTDKCSPNCSSIVFDRSVFTQTIQMEWNLICSRSQLPNLGQTIAMCGIIVGNFIFGTLSDKYGRRNPLICGVILQLISSTAAAFAPWFWLFVILRFIAAIATGGIMVTSFVLIMELVGAKWRTQLGIICNVPYDLGQPSLALIAYFFRDWHHIQLAITLPGLVLLSYYWIVPESPRWLLTTKQPEKAIEIMKRAAHCNKLPSNSIEEDVERFVRRKIVKQDKGKFFDLFRKGSMRLRTICICFNWFGCGVCFYGGAQYIGQLGGNIFLNITICGTLQLSGTLSAVWVTQYLDRRHTVMASNVLAGLSFFVISVVPNDLHWVKVLFASFGMYGMSLCFSTIYIYSAELFPTIIRNRGVAIGSISARIGSMIAPFIVGLALIKPWLPSIIFGITPPMCAILDYYLPETRGLKLPETFEDIEMLRETPQNLSKSQILVNKIQK
ncbi:hypothetical protein RI129_001980 [Pyrocoelia pectoralis]|uniref:Major facilitator superfamily (MFS) profile domain-containing protein n=1 Tax=Pyrocoelia pectoralis TaxID=417401 RepID=A0AAN7VV13_9COLE